MATSLKPSEVSDILLGQLQDMKSDLQFEEIGKALQVSDGILLVLWQSEMVLVKVFSVLEALATIPATERSPATCTPMLRSCLL